MSDLNINEFISKLPEDVREKLKNCKSEEEAMDILKDNMIEIPEEAMDKVAGGHIYNGKCDWNDCKKYDWRQGDSREEVSAEQAAKDFEEGRITGADFFK